MVKKSFLLRLMVPMVVIGMLASCNGKSGGSSLKKSSASNYPVVEISEGLSKATNVYSQVYEFQDGYAKVRGGDFYGLIDKNGKAVLPCDYSSLNLYGKVALVKTSSWGVVGLDGREIVPCRYKKDEIAVFPEEELIRIEKGAQEYHFINYDGKDIIPNGLHAVIGSGKEWNKDDRVTFSEGLAATSLPTNDPYHTYGFVDKSGKVVIPARYRYPALFQDGLAWVDGTLINKKGETVSLKNEDGTSIIPSDLVNDFGDYDHGILITKGSNNRYGLWDIIKKKEIVAPVYDYILSDYDDIYGCRFFVKDSIILVENDKKYGAVSTSGKEIVPCQYSFAEIIKGFVRVCQEIGYNHVYGLYDKNGKELLKCGEYSKIDVEENGIVAMRVKGEDLVVVAVCVFDFEGNELTTIDEVKSIDLRPLSEGLVAIDKEQKGYGFYDTNGNTVIQPKYEDAGFFSEGLAPVKLNGKWGYVNHAGKDTFGEQ